MLVAKAEKLDHLILSHLASCISEQLGKPQSSGEVCPVPQRKASSRVEIVVCLVK